MFAVPLPSVAAINNIFGTLMKGRFGSGTSPLLAHMLRVSGARQRHVVVRHSCKQCCMTCAPAES